MKINLYRTEIGTTGFTQIVNGLCENKILKSLNVGFCEIDLQKSDLLKKLLTQNQTLEKLVLRENTFDDYVIFFCFVFFCL